MSSNKPSDARLAYLLVPIVLIALAVQGWELSRFARRQMGIVILEEEDEVFIEEVRLDAPAWEAGLRPGDKVRYVRGRPIVEMQHFDLAMKGYEVGDPLPIEVEREGVHRVFDVQPGLPFPLLSFLVTSLTVLLNLLIGPWAIFKRPGYLRAQLLFFLTLAIALEIALPFVHTAPYLWMVLAVLLNGFQMGVELHLASVIPERQRWLSRAPWAIPAYYVVGLGWSGLIALAVVLERMGQYWLPWTADGTYIFFGRVGSPLWAAAVLFLLGRQALRYPESRGRAQAGLVALGVVPWALVTLLSETELWQAWISFRWEDLIWNASLVCYPLTVLVILYRDASNQERILLDLAKKVHDVTSVGEISKIVSMDLHSAFHPKGTHVFYRQRHSRDLTLGHSTGIRLEEEVIPQDSPLLRIAEAYGEAVDYPQGLMGLPPAERQWLDQLEASLVVPLTGRDKRLLGLLVLGQKKSEEPYTHHDRQLLGALTSQIALVYENARLKDRVDQSQRIQKEVLAKLGEQEINLVKECPTCGTCYDATESQCPQDRSELLPSLPIERLISGRYRLDRRIDKGGMGAIYQATDQHLSRQVAVKVLLNTLATEEIAKRFENEARLTASLRHPNVVTVHDYGTTGTGAAFLVLELLAGTTLAKAIKASAPLDPHQVANWFDQTCDGVKAAHRASIIHRDLKPANIFIADSEEGEPTVKILDFGVAKANSEALEQSGGLTSPGSLIGTFRYMAPEQLRGVGVDARSDIFALAVMAVESLTGQRPFAGKTPAELLESMATPYRWPGNGPAAGRMNAVLARCLSVAPKERYESVEAMQRELIPAIRGLVGGGDPS